MNIKRRASVLTLWHDGLCDPGGIGLTALGAVVAGAYNRGEYKLVVAVGRYQQLGVAQLHLHIVTGHDVGHVHLEDIGQVLLQQRCRFTFLLGCVVFHAGLLFLFNLGGDQPVGQAHIHAMYGCAGGAGKYVLGFDGALTLVFVGLHHDHVGNYAADAHIHLGRLERQLVYAGVVAFDKEVGAFGLETGCCVSVLCLNGAADQHDKTDSGQGDGDEPQPARQASGRA